MNNTLDEVLVEAYALAKTNVVILHTIELRHPSIASPIFLVQGFLNRELTVDGEDQVFRACAFDFTLPGVNDGGIQELQIRIDNVNNQVAAFCETALAFDSAPVEIHYRPYSSDDPTTSLMVPALRLFLLDVQINLTQVSGRAVPVDFNNLGFPNEDYSPTRFPGLVAF